jgi:hypothetical protein
LGEFSPIGYLFVLGSLLKMKEVRRPNFGGNFFRSKSFVLLLAIHWFGYILGDFFPKTHLVAPSLESIGILRSSKGDEKVKNAKRDRFNKLKKCKTGPVQ